MHSLLVTRSWAAWYFPGSACRSNIQGTEVAGGDGVGHPWVEATRPAQQETGKAGPSCNDQVDDVSPHQVPKHLAVSLAGAGALAVHGEPCDQRRGSRWQALSG